MDHWLRDNNLEVNATKTPPTGIKLDCASHRGYDFKPEQRGVAAPNPEDFNSTGTASGAAIRKPREVVTSVVPTSTDQRVGNANATLTSGYARNKG